MTPARFLCWKATQDAGPPLPSDCAISGYRTISLDSACRLFVGVSDVGPASDRGRYRQREEQPRARHYRRML